MKVEFLDCPSFIPNVFTPNNDGINETFYIDNINNRVWGLQIYNRWGNLVYANKHYQNDWQAESVASGLYYYILENELLKRKYKGWLQIIK